MNILAHSIALLAFALFSSLLGASELPLRSAASETIGKTMEANIPYAPSADPHQTFDLYLHALQGKEVPLIVWMHGGGWYLSNKHWINVPYLIEHGFALASVDYRLSGDALFPAQIRDCNTALGFLVRNAARYGFDTDRIVIGGASAGGHLALLLGLARHEKTFGADPNIRPRAVLDFFGPTNLLSLVDESRGLKNFTESEKIVGKLLGGAPNERPELARAASPVTYLQKGEPPVLILHGDTDDLVPYSQSQLLHARLDELRVTNELITVKGAGHDGPMFTTPEIQEKVVQFLRSTGVIASEHEVK